MSGKSRRRKGKYLTRGKKGEGGVSRPTLAAQSPDTTSARRAGPALLDEKPVPPVSRAVPLVKPAAQHQYITTELLAIGLLAGAMLIILVVLASVLA